MSMADKDEETKGIFSVLEGKGEDPIYFYDERSKRFYIKRGPGAYVSVPESSMKRHLRGKGYLPYIPKEERDATLSELDAKMEEIELDNRVMYAGPLAGHWSGYKMIAGNPVLVTEDPNLIVPVKPGENDDTLAGDETLAGVTNCRGWPTLGRLIKNLLHDECVGDLQLIRYFGYLAHVLDCLYNDTQGKVICLVIAGERESGKTLLFNDIHAALFGGRVGKPYDYMVGRDSFNDDFLSSTLLSIDDEVNNTHMDARIQLGEKSKKMVANSSHKIRGMHKSGFTLNPLWALTIMCNEEPANLMILPPIEEDNQDKFLIFRAYRRSMPMPASSVDEQKRFWAKLMSELPKFVWWIRNEWQTPADIQGRFGVKWWHHPIVTEALLKLSPAWVIYEYIERTIFKDNTLHPNLIDSTKTLGGYEWMGTAADLRAYLSESGFKDDGNSTRGYLTLDESRRLPNSQWLGKRLTELSNKFEDQIFYKRTGEKRIWHIIAPDYDAK